MCAAGIPRTTRTGQTSHGARPSVLVLVAVLEVERAVRAEALPAAARLLLDAGPTKLGLVGAAAAGGRRAGRAARGGGAGSAQARCRPSRSARAYLMHSPQSGRRQFAHVPQREERILPRVFCVGAHVRARAAVGACAVRSGARAHLRRGRRRRRTSSSSSENCGRLGGTASCSGARAARLPLSTKSALAAAFPLGESGPSRSKASGRPAGWRATLPGRCSGESRLVEVAAGARLGVVSSSGMGAARHPRLPTL